MDSLFYKVADTTSNPIGVEGSHEVAGSSDKIFIWSYGINSGCFQPHVSLNLCPVLPADHGVIPYLQDIKAKS